MIKNNSLYEPVEVRADFSERLVAFMIDGLLFTAGFFLSLKALAPEYPVLISPHGKAGFWAWLGIWILYNAVFSAHGRATLGKRIVGIRVISESGNPLTFSKAMARSLGYLLSSFFNLGFFWAFFHPRKKAWHDFLASSQVVRANPEEPSPAAQIAVQSAAAGFVVLLVGTWVWQNLVAPNYYGTVAAVYGYQMMEGIGRLQERHKIKHGSYSESLYSLTKLTPDPEGYFDDVFTALDPNKEFKIQASKNSYKIVAHARDSGSTRLEYP